MAKHSLQRPPTWLPEAGKALWRSVLRWIGPRLKPEDAIVLGELCDAYATLRAASAKIAELGVLVEGRREGETIANPACRIAAAARQQVAGLCAQLGLDPRSRGVEPAEQKDDLDSFLAGEGEVTPCDSESSAADPAA